MLARQLGTQGSRHDGQLLVLPCTTGHTEGTFRLGIIGLGAIGQDMLKLCAEDEVLRAKLSVPAVLVRRPRSETTPEHTLITNEVEQFFAAGPYDAVLEVAGHATVVDHGERVLSSGADFLVTSVGSFPANVGLHKRLVAAAERGGSRLVVPSAGVGALDILSAAAVGGLDSVSMVVRKDPSAWYGTIAEEQFDLPAIDAQGDPKIIFEGTAQEGSALYPQNVNISAAVAMAGLGLENTKLQIVADPTVDTHVVEVSATGAFGSFNFTESVAISEHRKTGKIVAMAVAKTVKQLVSSFVIGH